MSGGCGHAGTAPVGAIGAGGPAHGRPSTGAEVRALTQDRPRSRDRPADDGVDLDAPGAMAAGQAQELHTVVRVPGTGEASVAGRLVQQDCAVRVRFRTGAAEIAMALAAVLPTPEAPH